jgi:biofilm PGA synthesis N-glycosyltransferase PgaC
MIYFALFICVLYGTLILSFVKGFDQLEPHAAEKEEYHTLFSILIPFRNEAPNLPHLLNSLDALDYPKNKMEIILINDHSTDDFEQIIDGIKQHHKDLNISLIHNAPVGTSPKKEAIELGVSVASNPWIITTDADCIFPKNWLKAFDGFIVAHAPKMIVAPVTYFPGKRFLDTFQLLDFISLQGSTIGSFGWKGKGSSRPFLCNGANLCYEKKAFLDLDGFKGNKNIASGDDIFLLEKMYDAFPGKVQFIKSKEAIVRTSAQETLKGLLQQRVRWAAKASSYHHYFGKLVGLIVFSTNALLIILLILSLLNSFSWSYFGLIFLLKFNIDFILLYKTATFFDQKEVLSSYFLSSLVYPFFTVYVGLLSFKKSYTWKGRSFQK